MWFQAWNIQSLKIRAGSNFTSYFSAPHQNDEKLSLNVYVFVCVYVCRAAGHAEWSCSTSQHQSQQAAFAAGPLRQHLLGLDLWSAVQSDLMVGYLSLKALWETDLTPWDVIQWVWVPVTVCLCWWLCVCERAAGDFFQTDMENKSNHSNHWLLWNAGQRIKGLEWVCFQSQIQGHLQRWWCW